MEMFKNFQDYSSNIAVLTDSKIEVTYGQLESRVSSFEKYLESGELILILGSNDFQTLICYLAAIRRGTVVLMLSSNIEQNYLENLINSFKTKFIWGLGNNLQTISIDFHEIFKHESYTLLASKNSLTLPSDLALLLTTSGSTGLPSFVRISRKNLVANTNSIIQALGIKKFDRAITTLPVNYSYGLSIINSHLTAGASLVLNSNAIASREFWDLAILTKATSMGGVPFTYEMFRKFDSDFIAKSQLRKFTQAGGKLEKNLVLQIVKTVEELNGSFILMYGQTEATARISVLPFELVKENPESIGKPIPNGEIKLIGEDNFEISEPFQEGELRYFGPNVTLGYANTLEDLYSADNNNGSLDTGDIAYFDNNGLFYISGRKKRFIKLFGIRTSLDDIESNLQAEGFECVCSQIDDVLYIYTTEKKSIDKIRKFVIVKYKIRQSDFTISFIESVPRGESGKVLYSNLPKKVEESNNAK